MLWLKAFHVIFMVSWFAGIFYLPRLFVYHAATDNQAVSEQFKIMERRLLLFVTPFALLTAIFGFALMFFYGGAWLKSSGWMHAKLTLVLLLYVHFFYCFKLVKDFKKDQNTKPPLYYRFYNEGPVILMFAIVILAVVKPF